MKKEEIYNILNKIFRDIFDDDELEVTAATTSGDIEDWDSLEHINLVTSIENEFRIKFTMAQVTGMKDVGEMVDIIYDLVSGR